MENFSISNTTRKLPPIKKPLLKNIKEAVLGKNYELSIVFVGENKIRRLNKTYRQKNSVTDILSFNVDKNIGEIIICVAEAKKRAPQYDRTFKNYLYFLVIHGLHHLKGMEHSSRMEREEEIVRKRFHI